VKWPPTEKDDMEVLPIQAADMFAWTYRNMCNRYYNDDPGWQSSPLILGSRVPMPVHTAMLSRRDLVGLAKNVQLMKAAESWQAAVDDMTVNHQT
jgi:hypothetical protein